MAKKLININKDYHCVKYRISDTPWRSSSLLALWARRCTSTNLKITEFHVLSYRQMESFKS